MNRRDLAAFLGSPQAIREYEQSLASYTLTDLDNGYDNPDPEAPNPGTTTPTVPTLSVQGEYKAFVLRWERQTNLTNFDEYEVQVSDDDSTWYSLSFAGSDWKATLDATTPWASELLVHPNLPFEGTPEAPTALTLYYRVRRTTTAGVSSAWSTSVSATNLRIETGDIAADAITANKIDVSDLSAINADLGTVTAGILRSSDWDTTDGVEWDLSTGRLRMGGSSAPAIDFNPDAGTYALNGSVSTSNGFFKAVMTTGAFGLLYNSVAVGGYEALSNNHSRITGAFSGGNGYGIDFYTDGVRFKYWPFNDPITGTTLATVNTNTMNVDVTIESRVIYPDGNNTRTLGSTSRRWSTIYGYDLVLSDDITCDDIACDDISCDAIEMTGQLDCVNIVSGSSMVIGYYRGINPSPAGNSAIGDGDNDALDKIHIRSTTGSAREMDYSAGW